MPYASHYSRVLRYSSTSLATTNLPQLQGMVVANPKNLELRQHLAKALHDSGDEDDKIEAAMHMVIASPTAANRSLLRQLLHQTGMAREIGLAFASQAVQLSSTVQKAAVERYPVGIHGLHHLSRRQSAAMAQHFSQKAQEEAASVAPDYEPDRYVNYTQEAHNKYVAEKDAEAARYSELASQRHEEAAEEHRKVGEDVQAEIHEQAAEANRRSHAIRLALVPETPAPLEKPKKEAAMLMPSIKSIRGSKPKE